MFFLRHSLNHSLEVAMLYAFIAVLVVSFAVLFVRGQRVSVLAESENMDELEFGNANSVFLRQVRKDMLVAIPFAGRNITGHVARVSGKRVKVAAYLNGHPQAVRRKLHELRPMLV